MSVLGGLMSFSVLMTPVLICYISIVIPELWKILGVVCRRMKLSEHWRPNVFSGSFSLSSSVICSLGKNFYSCRESLELCLRERQIFPYCSVLMLLDQLLHQPFPVFVDVELVTNWAALFIYQAGVEIFHVPVIGYSIALLLWFKPEECDQNVVKTKPVKAFEKFHA